MSKIKQFFSSSKSQPPQIDPVEAELANMFPFDDTIHEQLLERNVVIDLETVYEDHFSTAPSTFYLLGRMHEKGYGINKDDELAFSYYYITNQKKGKLNFFAPNFLSYRKYKAKKKIESPYFKKIEEGFKSKVVTKFIDDDDKICCICYVNMKNIAFIPCMHKICSDCYAKIPDNEKCPICRGIILFPKKLD